VATYMQKAVSRAKTVSANRGTAISKVSHTGVNCKRCNTQIRVNEAGRVSEEFSVPCPRCGSRAFYRVKELKTFANTQV